jgi:hypothetical protein
VSCHCEESATKQSKNPARNRNCFANARNDRKMVFMLTEILVNTLGLLVFLFIFWEKLREDYAKEKIFAAAFYILLGVLAGCLVALKFFPTFWFWSAFLTSSAGLIAGLVIFHLRFFETFDAFVISFLPWLDLILLNDSVKKANPVSFSAFIVVSVLIALYYFLDTHYKSFAWYRSGKVGFAGLMTAGVFFTLRAALANFALPVLSFAESYEPVASGALATLFFVSVFFLSREN